MANGTYTYQSDFAKKYIAKGEAKGRAEGLLKLVRHRLGRAPRGLAGKLEALDAEALGQLFDRVLKTEDPGELRALLAALPHR